MVNIIKNKVLESLKANGFEYTSKQLDSIIRIVEFLENNLLKIDDNVVMTMFLNHMLIFFKRLENKEDLIIEDVDVMFEALNENNVKIARTMLEDIGQEYGFAVSDSEIFLIATHVENIANQV